MLGLYVCKVVHIHIYIYTQNHTDNHTDVIAGLLDRRKLDLFFNDLFRTQLGVWASSFSWRACWRSGW